MSATPRLLSANRSQVILASVDVEKLIADDHPARAIWEFVGRLDLEPYQLAIKSVEGSAGRPAYDPRLLVSIWILATSMGEGSARERRSRARRFLRCWKRIPDLFRGAVTALAAVPVKFGWVHFH